MSQSPGTEPRDRDPVPPPAGSTNAARQGTTLGVMRYVLGISLVLVIVAFVLAYVAF